MGDTRGFIRLRRAMPLRESVEQRVQHSREFYRPLPDDALREQGARCMDCGVPFCQSDSGCPVRNVIPEWNDLVHTGQWREASDILHSTNNFPEFTGRLCPAPCESACVLSLIDEPVTIRNIEQAIADRAFREGWIAPRPPRRESGRSVAVVGSGPAGLAAAQELRRAGHAVTVFERADRPGGLLRYGIPEFKLEKSILDRRLDQMRGEGVVFKSGVNVGEDLPVDELRDRFDAVCVAIGAGHARDLVVPGRKLAGVHLAMEFLTQQNHRQAGDVVDPRTTISARGQRVIIIGGGDTGSDCAGTAIRQGAKSVRQFELLPQPGETRSPSTPWPLWPMQLRTSHAHEEGCERTWSVATTAFAGAAGTVRVLHAVRVETETTSDGVLVNRPAKGTEFTMDADLVLLAMGFAGAEDSTLLRDLGVARERGLVATDGTHRSDVDGVFVAGDARRGASLIVWAIREGRDAAAQIDQYLRKPALV
jgi:glutamate synthase (NADPH/NADH) small chain